MAADRVLIKPARRLGEYRVRTLMPQHMVSHRRIVDLICRLMVNAAFSLDLRDDQIVAEALDVRQSLDGMSVP